MSTLFTSTILSVLLVNFKWLEMSKSIDNTCVFILDTVVAHFRSFQSCQSWNLWPHRWWSDSQLCEPPVQQCPIPACPVMHCFALKYNYCNWIELHCTHWIKLPGLIGHCSNHSYRSNRSWQQPKFQWQIQLFQESRWLLTMPFQNCICYWSTKNCNVQ